MRCLPLLSLLLLSACYDSAGEPGLFDPTPAATTTLAQVRSLYAGETFQIASDVVIDGYVTSHDRAGNFYRSLIVEHEGAAAEIMAGIDGLHNSYPIGHRLTIKLKGLAIGDNHGILQIGRLPAPGSGYATDYIGSRAALDLHLFCSNECVKHTPLVVGITALSPALAGRLVRIDGLRYTPEELEQNLWLGTRRFTDSDGHTLYTYTRPYANFAQEKIPLCEVLLSGILQCDRTIDGSMRYTLRLRDEKDCLY